LFYFQFVNSISCSGDQGNQTIVIFRTIPNTFALILFQFAISCWLLKQCKNPEIMICFLTVSITVFRVELAPMALIMVLYDLYIKKYSFFRAVVVFIVTFLISLFVIINIDSYYWQKWPMWPELQVFIFNGYKAFDNRC
jgi:alpha-1,6-mannosyltransferase